MSNVIDSIQLSGITYGIKGSGGTETIELTQAQYDALVDKDPNVFYIITDAQAGDLTNYYTKTETNTLLGGKQDTLVSGTNIKTINNENILGSGNIDIQGGGGKAVSAGTNISITTGETADTINCTLPITIQTQSQNYNNLLLCDSSSNTFAGDKTSNNIIFGNSNSIGSFFDASKKNIIIGDRNTINQGMGGANPSFNFFVGDYNNIGKNYAENASHTVAFGTYLTPKNSYEYAFGKYNNSVTSSETFGDSGNTLFSVGNGTADDARHNAFEIRQNGDIYISSGGTDIKLQDHLGSGGGGGGMTEDDELLLSTALTDLNDRKIDAYEVKSNYQKKGDYVTTNTLNTRLAEYETALEEQNVEEVTAYALNDLNNKFGGLKITKITESEYAALTTKDENTLYVVVADPS